MPVHTFGQPSSIPEEVSSLEDNYRARLMIRTFDASCRRWCGGNQNQKDGIMNVNGCVVRALLIPLSSL